MSKKTIMLACAAGMSTSMLVAKMQAAAKDLGKDYEIFATSLPDVDNKIKSEKPDIVMLAPQVKYAEDEVKAKAADAGAKFANIDMMSYGMMDGTKILAEAEKEL